MKVKAGKTWRDLMDRSFTGVWGRPVDSWRSESECKPSKCCEEELTELPPPPPPAKPDLSQMWWHTSIVS